MHIIEKPISLEELKEKHSHFFEKMVKVVIDVESGIMAVDAEMHADLQKFLMEKGHTRKNLWGAKIYFSPRGLIELNSMINERPEQGNFGIDIVDPDLQKKVLQVIMNWVV